MKLSAAVPMASPTLRLRKSARISAKIPVTPPGVAEVKPTSKRVVTKHNLRPILAWKKKSRVGTLVKRKAGGVEGKKAAVVSKTNKKLKDDTGCPDPSIRQDAAAVKKGSMKGHKRKVVHKKIPCEVCKRLYNSFYMTVHMRKHTLERPFSCDCGKLFTTLTLLNTHQRRYHTRDTSDLKCEQCHKIFASKGSLTVHRLIHSSSRPFTCQVCGRGFKQRAVLNEHVKTHGKVQSFQCEVCGKSFRSNRSVIRHRETAHEGVQRHFPCEKCDKVFQDRSAKWRHSKRHEEGYKMIACSLCDKKFHEAKVLHTHMLIHQNAKPFSCEVCLKKFRHKSVLQRHLSIHTGIKAFRCQKCQRQFDYRVQLSRHKCKNESAPKAAPATNESPGKAATPTLEIWPFRTLLPEEEDARAVRPNTSPPKRSLISLKETGRTATLRVVNSASPRFAPLGVVPRSALPGRTTHLAIRAATVRPRPAPPAQSPRRQSTSPKRNAGTSTDSVLLLVGPLPSAPTAVPVLLQLDDPSSTRSDQMTTSSFVDLASASYVCLEQGQLGVSAATQQAPTEPDTRFVLLQPEDLCPPVRTCS